MKEVRVLGDDPDGRIQRRRRRVAQVDAVDGDRTGVHVVEARDQHGDGGLAGAARTDQGRHRSRFDTKLMSWRTAVRGVSSRRATASSEASDTSSAPGYAKVHVREAQLGGTRWDRRRRSALFDHGLEIQHFEETFEAHHRRHVVDVETRQLSQRTVEPPEVRGQRDDGADGNDPVNDFDPPNP